MMGGTPTIVDNSKKRRRRIGNACGVDKASGVNGSGGVNKVSGVNGIGEINDRRG